MRRPMIFAFTLLVLAPSAAVRADGAPPEGELTRAQERRMEPWLLVGARVGVVIPQAFNKLETNFVTDVEVAYQLPFWYRRLGLFFDIGYSQPTEQGTTTDPRVSTNGGTVGYDMTLQDLALAFGVQYRHALGRWIVPYVGAGAKVHLTRTIIDQNAGQTSLGENSEENTRVGFIARAGLGVHLGPGDLVAELDVEYTPVDHLITGDNNTGHLGFLAGYLLRF